MKKEEISFKDLTKGQLETLKGIYIENRVDAMSEKELRTFAKEVLDLQVRGTVGNEEEREIWREMKEYFDHDFGKKIKEVLKIKGAEDITVDLEQKEFEKRLEVLEQRKQEKSPANEDMW